MRRGHGTSRPCGTPLGCLPGAAAGRSPAPERPGNRPAAAPRPVAAVEQHRAADQPTASMDAAALRFSRPAADSNCLGGPDVLPIPATADARLAADASAPPGLDSPALLQRRRAVRQLQLGSPLNPASLDPIHLQQSRTSRGKTAHISEQATADRHGRRRRLDQARWIGSARRRRPPQHPPKHKQCQETEGNGISKTTTTQKPLGRCL